jgi:hypothetical protein
MQEKSLSKQALIVAFSAFVGWITLYFGIPLFASIVQAVFGLGGLGVALLLAYAFPFIAFFISLLVVGYLLFFLKIEKALLIAIPASIIISSGIGFVLDYAGISMLLKMVYSLLLFVIVYKFFWFLFSGLKTKLYIPLIISIILSGLALYYLPTAGRQVVTQKHENKIDKNMKQTGIEYYAPKGPTGRFELTDIEFMTFPDAKDTSYSWVVFVFTNGTVTLFKAPDWYDPPKKCGYHAPSKEFIPLYQCLEPFTTVKGTTVYPASRQSNPKPDRYFAKINNTLLVLNFGSSAETTEEVKNIVDSFEKVTLEELDALKDNVKN